jgi:hypothetical protein
MKFFICFLLIVNCLIASAFACSALGPGQVINKCGNGCSTGIYSYRYIILKLNFKK